MSDPVKIRGNKRMSNYGQLVYYEASQEPLYTWHSELDYIIKKYPITNRAYEYDEYTNRFSIRTKVNASVLTERQKKFLDFDPWNRPLRTWVAEVTIPQKTNFANKYGRGPFEWIDTFDSIEFRWTTIENKGIRFFKYK